MGYDIIIIGGAPVFLEKFLRHRETIAYLFFGGLTTLVNYICYFSLSYLGMYYATANAIAIVISVLFAYVTNKRWVFRSHTTGWKATTGEFLKFIASRLFSALLDMGLMVLLVSGLQRGDIFAKIFTGVVVIVVNYVTSKWITFRKIQ